MQVQLDLPNRKCGVVYLIHFAEHFKHARHYIGFAQYDALTRLTHHKEGTGSRLLNALNKAGIDYYIVRLWRRRTRGFERKLKNKKGSKLLCPICNPTTKNKRRKLIIRYTNHGNKSN